MDRNEPCSSADADLLGQLAMAFRGTRDENERRHIASDYSDAVVRLINSGSWEEAPVLEDMLPDEWMPEKFFEFWLSEQTVP